MSIVCGKDCNNEQRKVQRNVMSQFCHAILILHVAAIEYSPECVRLCVCHHVS